MTEKKCSLILSRSGDALLMTPYRRATGKIETTITIAAATTNGSPYWGEKSDRVNVRTFQMYSMI